jgi:hypothetical protein
VKAAQGVPDIRLSTLTTPDSVMTVAPQAFETGHFHYPPARSARAAASRAPSRSWRRGKLTGAKTTQSGFTDFHRDEFRALADTTDRILATSMPASWA